MKIASARLWMSRQASARSGRNSMSAYACFLIAVGLPVGLSAQAIRVTGQIPCAGRLDLVNAGPSLRGESSGRSVQVRITGAGEDRVPVVLSLRTNCGYRVAAA